MVRCCVANICRGAAGAIDVKQLLHKLLIRSLCYRSWHLNGGLSSTLVCSCLALWSCTITLLLTMASSSIPKGYQDWTVCPVKFLHPSAKERAKLEELYFQKYYNPFLPSSLEKYMVVFFSLGYFTKNSLPLTNADFNIARESSYTCGPRDSKRSAVSHHPCILMSPTSLLSFFPPRQ